MEKDVLTITEKQNLISYAIDLSILKKLFKMKLITENQYNILKNKICDKNVDEIKD